VVGACQRSAAYVNDRSNNIEVAVALLTPHGDSINAIDHNVGVYTGPEHDVLTRYFRAAKACKADYIVRITSDCPLIPPGLISKHIFAAANHGLDYTTNVFPKAKTYPDGFDCEVVSYRMLEWLDANAGQATHREHVTSLLHEMTPDWCKKGGCYGNVDNQHLKLSIDEKADYDFACMYMDYMQSKIDWLKNNCEVIFTW